MSDPSEYRIGDVVRLRKPHPCGNVDFEVVRLGADIGLRCLTCGRRILLPRRLLEQRTQSFIRRTPEPPIPAEIEPR